jgi:hypothetical protein
MPNGRNKGDVPGQKVRYRERVKDRRKHGLAGRG